VTVSFYKLQLAGNGFILVDAAAHPELARDGYPQAARALADRRYGVGATAVVFVERDNEIRVHSPDGSPCAEAADALLCAARYAFDSGRAAAGAIALSTPRGKRTLEILGAHEFRLDLGSPFALLGGRVVTPNSDGLVEIVDRNGTGIAITALHVQEDAIVAFPQPGGIISHAKLVSLAQRGFPGRAVTPALARAVTRDTVLARAVPRTPSGACAAAAAVLVSASVAGLADRDAVVIFEQPGTDGQPDASLARDRDDSRRLAVSWDADKNDIHVVGTGGYLFEGKFDLPGSP